MKTLDREDLEIVEDRRLATLERNRLEALARQDALNYVKYCNKRGITEPEDTFLYERGIVEIINRDNVLRAVEESEQYNSTKLPENSKKPREDKPKKERVMVHPDTYKAFLEEGEMYYTGDAIRYRFQREKIISKYFPRHFPRGFEDKSNNEVFGIYRHLMDHARKVVDNQ